MSLRSPIAYCIPLETQRVAHAAFPKGNPYIRLYDTLGPIYINPEFAHLFPKTGHPAQAPAQLALVTIMQFAEGLSDAQAADAVRSRIDWKYLLALPLTDPGFDASVLSEFRSRLLAHQAEALLFEIMLTLFRDQRLLKDRGRQRSDSTHVLAAIHLLTRLECVGESLRHALNCLASLAPDWLRSWVPSSWFERYGQRFENSRLPPGKPQRSALAAEIGTDGVQLLHLVDDPATPAWVREVPAVKVLRQVWAQQFSEPDEEGTVRWKTAEELPPAAELIGSPYDPDARLGKKRETEWVGFKVHVTESCDDEDPHLVTNIETTAATTPDSAMTATLQKHLVDRNLEPSEHLVDAGYMSVAQLGAAQADGTDLLGPVGEDQSWQARAGEGFGAGSFVIDWEQEQARCPQGKESVRWKEGKDRGGHEVVTMEFRGSECGRCEVREKCVKGEGPRRITVRKQGEYEMLLAARERQKGEEFKAAYAKRAGIEGTLSQGVRQGSMRQSRYIGLAKTRLLMLLIGAALNLVRVAAWLADESLAQTRRSGFARLAPT